MDPNATLMAWAMAVLNEDREAANEAHAALTIWMGREDFEPDWGVGGRPSKRQFDSYDYGTGRIS